MSWPSDGGPRFIVSSIDGPRTAAVGSKSAGYSAVDWMVLDRAYCRKVVATFGDRYARLPATRKMMAQRYAAQLEAAHEAHLSV